MDAVAVGLVGFIVLFVLMPGGLFVIDRYLRRRAEQRVRRWADEHGYALLRFECRRPAWLALYSWAGVWHIEVHDSEGGQRVGTVHFGHFWMDLPWGKMEVRWR